MEWNLKGAETGVKNTSKKFLLWRVLKDLSTLGKSMSNQSHKTVDVLDAERKTEIVKLHECTNVFEKSLNSTM